MTYRLHEIESASIDATQHNNRRSPEAARLAVNRIAQASALARSGKSYAARRVFADAAYQHATAAALCGNEIIAAKHRHAAALASQYAER